MPSSLISADQVRRVCAIALERHGATPEESAAQADQLLEGELRGHPSHGLLRLKVLTQRLDAGLIVSGVEPAMSWSSTSALRVDGRSGFGPTVAHRTLDLLIPRARESGAAVAAIGNAHHLGMLAPYVERASEAGCIGVAFTTSEALVHPWGGRGALVGTNPIGIGIPTRDGILSLDMSTGAVSAGKIIDHATRGLPIPDGWAVDAEGHPTTDAPRAVEGAISPFGGSKGFALGVALEALVGLLSHTAYGTDVHGTLDATMPITKGDVFILISLPSFAADPDDERLAAYLDEVRASGVDGTTVSIPGDRARRTRAERLAEGVVVDDATWQEALQLAGEAA